MNPAINNLIRDIRLKPGASEHLIDQVQTKLQTKLPDDYLDFMRQSNGADGWIGQSYLILWPLEDVPTMNSTLEVSEHAPGLLFFGGDGGTAGYAFDLRKEPIQVIEADYISIGSEEEHYIVAPSFLGFLEALWARD